MEAGLQLDTWKIKLLEGKRNKGTSYTNYGGTWFILVILFMRETYSSDSRYYSDCSDFNYSIDFKYEGARFVLKRKLVIVIKGERDLQ